MGLEKTAFEATKNYCASRGIAMQQGQGKKLWVASVHGDAWYEFAPDNVIFLGALAAELKDSQNYSKISEFVRKADEYSRDTTFELDENQGLILLRMVMHYPPRNQQLGYAWVQSVIDETIGNLGITRKFVEYIVQGEISPEAAAYKAGKNEYNLSLFFLLEETRGYLEEKKLLSKADLDNDVLFLSGRDFEGELRFAQRGLKTVVALDVHFFDHFLSTGSLEQFSSRLNMYSKLLPFSVLQRDGGNRLNYSIEVAYDVITFPESVKNLFYHLDSSFKTLEIVTPYAKEISAGRMSVDQAISTLWPVSSKHEESPSKGQQDSSPVMRYCTRCGTQIKAGELFCTKCGLRFDTARYRSRG